MLTDDAFYTEKKYCFQKNFSSIDYNITIELINDFEMKLFIVLKNLRTSVKEEYFITFNLQLLQEIDIYFCRFKDIHEIFYFFREIFSKSSYNFKVDDDNLFLLIPKFYNGVKIIKIAIPPRKIKNKRGMYASPYEGASVNIIYSEFAKYKEETNKKLEEKDITIKNLNIIIEQSAQEKEDLLNQIRALKEEIEYLKRNKKTYAEVLDEKCQKVQNEKKSLINNIDNNYYSNFGNEDITFANPQPEPKIQLSRARSSNNFKRRINRVITSPKNIKVNIPVDIPVSMILKTDEELKQYSIFNETDFDLIENWIFPQKEHERKLIYRASRDGDKISIFHSLCDNKGPTLIVITTTKGCKIGAYTSKSLNDYSGWTFDEYAFIFSVSLKKKVKPRIYENALFCSNIFAFCFGTLWNALKRFMLSKVLSKISPQLVGNSEQLRA